MNVNWKEAILQAQKKIDQVLDIRPESVEVEVEEEPEPQEDVIDQNCSSPSQSSEVLGDDIVMLEPVLPPFLNNRYIGDDIQTIISSDIEHLTRASSRTASPERLKAPSDFEKELSISQVSPVPAYVSTSAATPEIPLPNPEDILNQAISGLRKELTEYKKANQILQNSHANIEREMEENRFSLNEKMVNMLNEEREHFNQEISQLKLTCSQAVTEKMEFEEKYRKSENYWSHTKKTLDYFRKQIAQMKNSLQETGETFASDFETFGAEIKRNLENQRRKESQQRAPRVIKIPCNCAKLAKEDSDSIVKHDEATQTNVSNPTKNDSNEYDKDENMGSSPSHKGNGNVTDLLRIIEQLENEKRHLQIQRKHDKREIEASLDPFIHGEKIEQLDEIMVDNEELKSILKQQALALTNNSS
ncbi:hypothetical protein GCK72_022214 [Caenorhabditis remanei]|uniref:Uncharacterized protein n=1 Tax=Caenorhabditis remanei TaxID=31234 RepID=A0A6A5FT59_CAERE|nr:hypothetical protein GCK72_022214 [Caenorhabditis remanei]KAF1745767.1 hypothetical protein GCK72_022214 [Caenorhabditis remanei]